MTWQVLQARLSRWTHCCAFHSVLIPFSGANSTRKGIHRPRNVQHAKSVKDDFGSRGGGFKGSSEISIIFLAFAEWEICEYVTFEEMLKNAMSKYFNFMQNKFRRLSLKRSSKSCFSFVLNANLITFHLGLSLRARKTINLLKAFIFRPNLNGNFCRMQ